MSLCHELEVRDYGNVKLECFNFKLQKPKVVRGGKKMKTYWKWKAMQGSIKFYMAPKCFLVQPFVKLNLETLFWELFGFLQNSKLIPLPQPRIFCLFVHIRIHEHLKFFSEHLWLRVIVIVGLNFLQKIGPKTQITNKEMFA
jgi:hypothetical protein